MSYIEAEKAGKQSPPRLTEMERMHLPEAFNLMKNVHHQMLNVSINICDNKTTPFYGRHGQED